MERPLIIALDVENKKEAINLLEGLPNESLALKVGMELFYKEGPGIIEAIKERGHWIFLDLKLHDIPNTVKRAMKQLAELGVDLVNVHVAGGHAMMTAAREGLEAGKPAGVASPLLIGVTQLTSTDETMLHHELLIEKPLQTVVESYAKLAQSAGLNGVVCSAQEVPLIHEICGKGFLTVTPGIRQVQDDLGDQVRVVTPEKARTLGSWGIVVGRSITAAKDPFAAYQAIQKAWEGKQ
ncbi:orotidine-5'-phosphate decarboxylase [Halalkalibacterium ligniniphilum]|uniref:orotidine-5'-phosphate decarboxylase n=1 Tax=Halalkalibacterium ligniniphilum TaxID=1134413 RepID=UPI00034C4322|nr:orotidine-5'-phosphate decarboxylase [Halalkalibacterium ligniniphilum]